MINRLVPLLFHSAYSSNIDQLLSQLREIEQNRYFLKEFEYKNYFLLPQNINLDYCDLIKKSLNNNASFCFINPNISLGVLHTSILALKKIPFDKKSIFCIDLPDIEFKFIDENYFFSSIENQLNIRKKKDYFKAIIPVFNSKSLDYSYIYQNDSFISANEKKDSSSSNASTGFYIFSSVNVFKKLAQKSLKGDPHFHNNFYISPIFNNLNNDLSLYKIMKCMLVKRHK